MIDRKICPVVYAATVAPSPWSHFATGGTPGDLSRLPLQQLPRQCQGAPLKCSERPPLGLAVKARVLLAKHLQSLKMLRMKFKPINNSTQSSSN